MAGITRNLVKQKRPQQTAGWYCPIFVTSKQTRELVPPRRCYFASDERFADGYYTLVKQKVEVEGAAGSHSRRSCIPKIAALASTDALRTSARTTTLSVPKTDAAFRRLLVELYLLGTFLLPARYLLPTAY